MFLRRNSSTPTVQKKVTLLRNIQTYVDKIILTLQADSF